MVHFYFHGAVVAAYRTGTAHPRVSERAQGAQGVEPPRDLGVSTVPRLQ